MGFFALPQISMPCPYRVPLLLYEGYDPINTSALRWFSPEHHKTSWGLYLLTLLQSSSLCDIARKRRRTNYLIASPYTELAFYGRACLYRQNSHVVGGEGVAPPESLDNEFTVHSATTYGITTHIVLFTYTTHFFMYFSMTISTY